MSDIGSTLLSFGSSLIDVNLEKVLFVVVVVVCLFTIISISKPSNHGSQL